MATSRPFAYNTGSTISGTVQVGDLAVGTPTVGFDATGLVWWMGPDEELGYVIADSVPNNSQPTPISGVTASVGFWRSRVLDESSFIEISNYVTGQSFTGGTQASNYLTTNGYWNSWIIPTPTPTPTPTITPTPTVTITPTPTITPTITPTPSIPAPTITYVTAFGFDNDSSSYSQNINLGGSGNIIVGINSKSVSSTSFDITGVTIDGLTATEIATIQSGQSISSLWGVNRSNTGSTGVVTVNFTQPQTGLFTAIWNCKNISSFTPISVGQAATNSSGTTTVNLSLNSGTNAIFALALGNSTSAITSTGVTENLNIAIGGSQQVRFFFGSTLQSSPSTYPISIGFPSPSTFQNTVLTVNLK